MFVAKVENVPNHPLHEWVVARYENGKLWYWGTWKADDRVRAERVAKELGNGIVLENRKDSFFDV